MKCPYSRKESQAAIDLFKTALSELDAALHAAAQRKAALEYELDRLRGNDKLERTLNELPVKQLKEKAGSLRIKLFQDAGFKTVGSIYHSTSGQLQRINGVGKVTADAALDAAKRIRDDFAEQYPVKVELSRRTEETERLVCDALACADAAEARRQGENLLDRYGKRLAEDIKAAENAQGFFMWIISVEKDQRAAVQAVEELFSFEEQGFIEKACELTDALYDALSLDADRAWDRFERDRGELEEVLRPFHAILSDPVGEDKTPMQTTCDEES